MDWIGSLLSQLGATKHDPFTWSAYLLSLVVVAYLTWQRNSFSHIERVLPTLKSAERLRYLHQKTRHIPFPPRTLNAEQYMALVKFRFRYFSLLLVVACLFMIVMAHVVGSAPSEPSFRLEPPGLKRSGSGCGFGLIGCSIAAPAKSPAAFENDMSSIFYTYSMESGVLVVSPQSLYLDRLRNGQYVIPQNTSLREESPIIAHRANNPSPTRRAITVSWKLESYEPYQAEVPFLCDCSWLTAKNPMLIFNLGNGRLRNPKVKVVVLKPAVCDKYFVKDSENQEITILDEMVAEFMALGQLPYSRSSVIQSFESSLPDFEQYVAFASPDAGKLRVSRACVEVTLTYTDHAGELKSMRTLGPISKPEYGGPDEPDSTYDITLRPEDAGKEAVAHVDRALSPNGGDHFLARVRGTATGIYTVSVQFKELAGNLLQEQKFRLDYFHQRDLAKYGSAPQIGAK